MGSIATDQNDLDGEDIRPRVLKIFDAAKKDGRGVYVSAPMVRYSKLPFRLLARHSHVDITYTPMMLAHEFVRSATARNSDFTTHPLERTATPDGRPHALIAQFASSDPEEFARAAELVAPWVDGVDLNCGCPQGWACREGIGCALMEEGELVGRIVRRAKERLRGGGWRVSVSVKCRIHKDLSQTISFLEKVQAAGVDYITIHGRLRSQRSSTPPNYEALALLRPHITVPFLVNGDVYTLSGAQKTLKLTGAHGVMAARGILENPGMFTGEDHVTPALLMEFLEWVVRCPIPFPLVLHHVTEMVGRMEGTTKKVKREVVECADLVDLIDFVEGRWGRG
ncbi:hypothetical protein M409DRAFT_66001 [Zasmidium cellare ATCC 36951]|uniref:DUS-like FMN-binding domain-containing protein n=1 Tax=Zasmidium cellare ATCC 36951 TaxID=1080233 RepID=A0A6A6CLG3_ZASCE|nr:uncharacterized protein M409DRAFT_66001 [Zasmidium cellare ATCC 36951]KAF2167975.1 hypothetical protein M409DRAFT_66001 [Zasmidium cellare ATCC 36951]